MLSIGISLSNFDLSLFIKKLLELFVWRTTQLTGTDVNKDDYITVNLVYK